MSPSGEVNTGPMADAMMIGSAIFSTKTNQAAGPLLRSCPIRPNPSRRRLASPPLLSPHPIISSLIFFLFLSLHRRHLLHHHPLLILIVVVVFLSLRRPRPSSHSRSHRSSPTFATYPALPTIALSHLPISPSPPPSQSLFHSSRPFCIDLPPRSSINRFHCIEGFIHPPSTLLPATAFDTWLASNK